MNYKAALKAIAPFVATLLAVAVEYLVTGEFDKLELNTALTGLSAALLAFLVPNDNNSDGRLDTTPVSTTTPVNKGTGTTG